MKALEVIMLLLKYHNPYFNLTCEKPHARLEPRGGITAKSCEGEINHEVHWAV